MDANGVLSHACLTVSAVLVVPSHLKHASRLVSSLQACTVHRSLLIRLQFVTTLYRYNIHCHV